MGARVGGEGVVCGVQGRKKKGKKEGRKERRLAACKPFQ